MSPIERGTKAAAERATAGWRPGSVEKAKGGWGGGWGCARAGRRLRGMGTPPPHRHPRNFLPGREREETPPQVPRSGAGDRWVSPPLLVHRGEAERRLPAPSRPPSAGDAPRLSRPLRSPPHAARPLPHSPAPGERSHRRRLLPSLPPSCQVEPGLPPPGSSFAIESSRRRKPAGPSLSGAWRRPALTCVHSRRGGKKAGGGCRRFQSAAKSRRPARRSLRGAGRGGRFLPAGTP